MFARMHVLKTTAEQYDQGLEIVRDQLLPWLRDTVGFRGLIRLTSRSEPKTLVITLWADEAALDATAAVAEEFSDLTAQTVGASRLALEDFEVSLFDVTDT